MTSLLAVVLMATPIDVVTPYKAILAAQREPAADASYQTAELAQSVLSPLRFVRVGGWSQGGHHPLPLMTFAIDGKGARVVVPEFENLDEDGYRRKLTALWLCPPRAQVQILEAGRSLDVKRMMTLEDGRKSVCESALPLIEKAPKSDETASLLLSLALESPVTFLDEKSRKKVDPRVQKVLESKTKGLTPGDHTWIAEPVPFTPWKSSKDGAKGMIVAGRFELELLVVELEWKSSLVLTTHFVGFGRQFIE